MKTKLLALSLALGITGVTCRHQKTVPPSEAEVRQTREALIGANRIMVKKDQEKIRAWVRRNHPGMQVSETGLWYAIDSTGSGEKAKPGQTVTLTYKLSLLDGTPCYSSNASGPKQFVVGQGGVESGLEEGVLMMRRGDKALFVLPPHLGQGFTGDGDRIPQRAILVYEVEMAKISP